MFDSRSFKTVTDWQTLEEGDRLDGDHGVNIYRVSGLDGDEFIVTRSFGRNGGDGVRVVHEGEDFEESRKVYETHRDDSYKLSRDSTFTMVTNGS